MRFSSHRLVAAAVLLLLVSAVVRAENLGTIGPVYPIGEENAIDMVMRKLREKERSGELKRLQAEAVKRSLNSIMNPKPVEGIATVSARTQRRIDPTVSYTKAVTTDDGRIVVPAGTRLNPLDMITLTKRLVFFDGSDPEQREAVRRLVAREHLKVKPILVAGSWLDLTRAWKTQVFYDQYGKLSQRFGIKAVPSVIRQEGKMLVLDEVPARELQ